MEWITSSDTMLEIVIDFINKIIPNEKFLIAGYSYGGYISRGIISKMVDKVDGIALICPIIITEYKKRNHPEHKTRLISVRILSSKRAKPILKRLALLFYYLFLTLEYNLVIRCWYRSTGGDRNEIILLNWF